jgi:O-antigen/teichoic acid export membrane protein
MYLRIRLRPLENDDEVGSPLNAPDTTRETWTALKNALKLGLSLIASWGISLAVRFVLPRHLGPELFGVLNFSDAFAGAFFVVATLGIDNYTRREVALRPEHAEDFLGGAIALRLAMTVVLLVVMGGALTLLGRPPEVRTVVYLYGLAQLFINVNSTFVSVLHATGKVDGISVLNVLSKLLWGAWLGVAIALDASLPWFAAALVGSEALRAVGSWVLVARIVKVKFRIDVAKTRAVLVASVSFYVNAIALAASGKTDVALLGMLANDTEVGWYGGAWGLAGLALIITPLIGSVLQPMLARIAARSAEELQTLMRRSIELVISGAVPLTLFLFLGADFLVKLLYGAKFAEAGLALKILSPVYVLTYLAIVLSMCLFTLNRSWTVTATSVMGLVLNPLLVLALVPLFLKTIGTSGGAAAAALANDLTEVATVVVLLWRLGPQVAFDRRSVGAVLKTAAVCAGVIVADHFLRGLNDVARLVLDALLYVAGVLGSGAVNVREMISFVKTARAARKPPAAPAEVTG